MAKFEPRYTENDFREALKGGWKTAGYIAKKIGCARSTVTLWLDKLGEEIEKLEIDDGQMFVYKLHDVKPTYAIGNGYKVRVYDAMIKDANGNEVECNPLEMDFNREIEEGYEISFCDDEIHLYNPRIHDETVIYLRDLVKE